MNLGHVALVVCESSVRPAGAVLDSQQTCTRLLADGFCAGAEAVVMMSCVGSTWSFMVERLALLRIWGVVVLSSNLDSETDYRDFFLRVLQSLL